MWVLAARTNSPPGKQRPSTNPGGTQTLTIGVPLWPLQAIAAFPLRDEPAPVPVYAIGISLMLAVAIASIVALVRGRNRSALLAIAFVAVMSYVVPLVLTAISFPPSGSRGKAATRCSSPAACCSSSAWPSTGTDPSAGADRGVRDGAPGVDESPVAGADHPPLRRQRVGPAIGWHAPSPVVLALLALGSPYWIRGVGIRSFGLRPSKTSRWFPDARPRARAGAGPVIDILLPFYGDPQLLYAAVRSILGRPPPTSGLSSSTTATRPLSGEWFRRSGPRT